MFKASSHVLARALLDKPETPVRGFVIGKFLISWDGKPGDYRETVETEDILGLT